MAIYNRGTTSFLRKKGQYVLPEMHFEPFHIKRPTQFPGEGGYPLIGKSTRIDQRESGEIGIDIQGNTVHRNVTTAADTHGTYFAFLRSSRFYPDPGSSRQPTGNNPVSGQGTDNHLLQQLNVTSQPHAATFQIQQRITDTLTGPVKGNVSPSVREKEIDGSRFQSFGRIEQIATVAVLSHRNHRRMLAEEPHIAGRIFAVPLRRYPKVKQLPLPTVCFGIRNQAPLLKNNLFMTLHNRVKNGEIFRHTQILPQNRLFRYTVTG